MFETGMQRVENRSVSISRPFTSPVVRGKPKTPMAFGVKYDVSVDEKEHSRLEKIVFDTCNECSVLPDVVERFKDRTGRYPFRVLIDSIYCTRANREFCRERGITMSGRDPGRPPPDPRRMPGRKRRRVRPHRGRHLLEPEPVIPENSQDQWNYGFKRKEKIEVERLLAEFFGFAILCIILFAVSIVVQMPGKKFKE